MNGAELLNTIIGGVAVILLAAIARSVAKVTGEFRRFMAEHVWLIATSLWTRDKVVHIMDKLNMPMEQPPPSDLPRKDNHT